MKELKDFAKNGASAFLALSEKLDGTTGIAAFAGNSSAMRAGVSGKIISIDYEEVGGANTPAVASAEGQVITIGKEQVLLAKVGDKPKAVTLRWDNGITMTLGLLLQGQQKTAITFADGKTVKAVDITLDNLRYMVGKSFKCTSFVRDSSNPIVRSNPDPDNAKKTIERSYAANCYQFEEI